MKVFPTWRYHESKGARIVESEEELAALGMGWVDSPAKFEFKEESSAEKPVHGGTVQPKRKRNKE